MTNILKKIFKTTPGKKIKKKAAVKVVSKTKSKDKIRKPTSKKI